MLMQTLEYIKSDLYRYYGNTNTITLIGAFVKNRIFRFQAIFRMCSEPSKGIIKTIGRVLYFFNKNKHNLHIPIDTKIGYGLYIGHNGPVIINPNTVIGNNCNLSQYLTIGSNERRAAIIGDNVYIGPNVCIVENVTIGNNLTIGAGSIVTKDLPNDCTAAGNYARVLNYNQPGKYIYNRWNIC